MRKYMKKIAKDYPYRVKAIRTQLGLTQPEFGEQIGVSFVTISRWENGLTVPLPMAWRHIVDLENKLKA
jgi:transcriptional regulator with XRE-family HTH domain